MKLLTTKQLCEALNMSDRTVRELVNSGKIPAYKINERNWRFDLDKVMKALEELK